MRNMSYNIGQDEIFMTTLEQISGAWSYSHNRDLWGTNTNDDNNFTLIDKNTWVYGFETIINNKLSKMCKEIKETNPTGLIN